MSNYRNPDYQRAPMPEMSLEQFRHGLVLRNAVQNESHAYDSVTQADFTVTQEPAIPFEPNTPPQIQIDTVGAIRRLVDASFVTPSYEGQPEPQAPAPTNVHPLQQPQKLAANEFPISELYEGRRSA